MANQDNIDRHNEVTREIILGMTVSVKEPGDFIEVSHKIMNLLERRGYKPHIRYCNQLTNGKAC